jgi:hypothetical protein
MRRTKVAHTSSTNLACINSILQSLPAGKPRLFPSIWAVKKEQVDVSQIRSLNRLLYRASHNVIRLVAAGELGGVPDILTLQARCVLTAGEEVADSFSSLSLIAVHLGAVEGTVAGKKT